MRRDSVHSVRARLRSEDGQAIVEFGLIATFLLIPLIAGIVQFGIAVSYWHDQNRLANQGARWASVNAWPGCPTTTASCTNADPTCSTPSGRSLQEYIRCEATALGLRDSVAVTICSPAGTSPTTGDAVTVRLESDWDFVPIVNLGTLDLRGEATMRLEVPPTKIAVGACI